jgi:hypothetical protein
VQSALRAIRTGYFGHYGYLRWAAQQLVLLRGDFSAKAIKLSAVIGKENK